MRQQADVELVEDSFKKYYFDHFDLVRAPDRTPEREFGYQKINSGMIRHIPIKDDRELRLLLVQNIPSDVYCSNACYTFPSLPMREKDWKEADLIFDIDAKDLGLPCRREHGIAVCSECGAATNIASLPSSSDNSSQSQQQQQQQQQQPRCERCSSTRLSVKSLPCKECIKSSKAEVGKLSEILVDDLGVARDDIHVYFSGNEGFHVYVYNSGFQQLGSRERSELADYIMFRGAVPETFGMKRQNKQNRSLFPVLDERGWRGRFARQVFGSKSGRPKAITELLAGGYPSFQKALEDLSFRMGVRIDPGVTMDVHRIFRLPGSLNSKSGLTKIRCRDLGAFDPYRDASFLGDDPVEVTADCPGILRLRGRRFGPYAGERVSLPAYAAVYLVCKGLATVAVAHSDR